MNTQRTNDGCDSTHHTDLKCENFKGHTNGHYCWRENGFVYWPNEPKSKSFDITKLKKGEDGFYRCKSVGGLDAVLYCLDCTGAMPIHGRFDGTSSVIVPRSWDLHGKEYSRECPSEYDLITEPDEPKRIEGWINIYPADDLIKKHTLSHVIHATKELADEAGMERIACIKISFVEGEGL